MANTSRQNELLGILMNRPHTTGELAELTDTSTCVVGNALNALIMECHPGLSFSRIPATAQYVTWQLTIEPIKESTVLTLTSLQDRLFAHMLSLPLGTARSDVLARAVDSCPSSVASSLLTLRSQGIVGSANDGGQYNFWFVTDKGKAELNKRAAFLREQEEQARREEAQRVAAATKARLLQAQREREAKAAQDKLFKPTRSMTPVTDALRKAMQAKAADTRSMAPVKDAMYRAMQDKGFDPISNPKYIVWSPSASVPPQVQYATHDEAVRVAGLQAQRFPKQVFIVCELQDVVLYTPPVQQAGQLLRGIL